VGGSTVGLVSIGGTDAALSAMVEFSSITNRWINNFGQSQFDVITNVLARESFSNIARKFGVTPDNGPCKNRNKVDAFTISYPWLAPEEENTLQSSILL